MDSEIINAENGVHLLATAAWAVREHAYAPYSRFRVGAAVRTRSGKVFTGCNVENLSFGLTMCAERVAIGAAVSAIRQLTIQDGRRRSFDER